MMLRRLIHEVDPRAGQQNSHRALAPADDDELDPRAGAAELSLMMVRRSITMSIRGQDNRPRTGHSLQRMVMSSTRGQVQLRTYADTRKSTPPQFTRELEL